jgi:DNA invertase Pin-like site-specific DNA recombinase
MPEPIRAVPYYRMSTARQEASIPQQREWARRYCRERGLDLVREFQDDGIPGSEIEQPPGLLDLIAFCEKRHRDKLPVRAVVLWDVDRLSRASSIRTAAVLDRLMGAGVTCLFTADEDYDLEEDLDLVLLNIRQDLSKAAYAKSIGKNVLRGRQAKAKGGQWPGGPIPIGYVKAPDGHLAPDPATAPLVRWIYERYATTADSLGDICNRLNADPVAPRPRSGKWASNYVRRILTHEVYLGKVVYGERSCGKYYRNEGGELRRVKGQGGRASCRAAEPGSAIVVEGAHEPLASPETFEAVARKLVGNRWTRERHSGRRGEWVLTGMAYCGGCGTRLTGRTFRFKSKGEVRYTYRRLICPGADRHGGPGCGAGLVDQDTVLAELAALVRQEFGKPRRVERVGRKIEALLAEQEKSGDLRRVQLAEKLQALDADLATAARRLLTLPESIQADAQREYEAMKRERAELAAALERGEDERRVSLEEARRMREALASIGRLEELFAQEDPALVRDVVSRIVEKVTLHFADAGPADSLGRVKRRLDYLDVTFRPELSHLFTAGNT